MEWNREKTLLLITEYKKRRGLWDMTCDDYRKKDVKHKLLKEVSECLGGSIPLSEIEKKFHTLRTQFHREINRIKRKGPYNSKWFGFKILQFLSLPHACRSNKARMKTEQIEENRETKYICNKDNTSTGAASTPTPIDDESNCSRNSNLQDEFLTVPRKVHAQNNSTRAHELEKLIEETTNEVDDIDETKPKLVMKQLNNVPYEQTYSDDVQETDNENLETHHHQQLHHHQQHHELEQHNTIEAVSFQANENGELHYQASSTPVSGNSAVVHQHIMPPRIYKVPRRDATAQEENYYSETVQQQRHQQQQPKHIYYDTSTHSTTILGAPTVSSSPTNGGNTIISPTAVKMQCNPNKVCVTPTQKVDTITAHNISMPLRDEYSTYGEYVANEMRAITNREVLIALKHKINTAIFEANMSELQK